MRTRTRDEVDIESQIDRRMNWAWNGMDRLPWPGDGAPVEVDRPAIGPKMSRSFRSQSWNVEGYCSFAMYGVS